MAPVKPQSPKTAKRPIGSALALRPVSPQEVRLRPAPLWSRALVWTIIGTASLGFVYAVFAKIDEVILAPGQLQPLGADRPIKAPFAGVVKKVHVKEGQQVSKGQELIQLDAEVSRKRAATLTQQMRLERERFSKESRSIDARADSLKERMDGLRRSLLTEKQIYNQIRPLADQGGIQKMQVLQQRNRVEQLESEIAQARANLQEVQAQLLKLQQESLRELSDLDRQLAEVKDTQNKEVLRAPLAGVVFGLVPSSPGYAASAGETLVKVVPGGTLEAKVFLTNRDVGFVKRGMPAQIRVDTFPYTQFGSITGRLKAVGTLPVPPDEQNPEPRFPAYVSMDRDYLQKGENRFPVSAGQSVQVNLVLREKRVISILSDATAKMFDSLRRIRTGSD
ncbi:MAG: HlyD family efflux transporter periplasmic adaptor subunit [Cyanobacteriota bacterium]|nr:HlyD family efflux transporter periplasmic adaptor subunit [Cyanobacteriota bacterium]